MSRLAGLSRRELLAGGALAAGAAITPGFLRDALGAASRSATGFYGGLQGPDRWGLMLPPGFVSRRIAKGLNPVPGTDYVFPVFPDGQATFRTGDGGWILVTNSEQPAGTGGGASAVRFAADGAIRSAYRILADTNINCAGGPTPWGTWLSCEETGDGMVWECDPAGVLEAEARPGLGLFKHEAVAVDPVGGMLYLTEDEGDGAFYRFIPANYPSLDSGRLQVAVVRGPRIEWHDVPDSSTAVTGVPTRHQVPGATRFDGGEGIWYSRRQVYFTTKGDKSVWSYDVRSRGLELIYRHGRTPGSSLDAVDNVTVSASGDLFVCEDGGNMEIGLLTPSGAVSPFLRFVGALHRNSEVCGVVFDPSGQRMYCTSQREALLGGGAGAGGVYEITGPFRLPVRGMPRDFVYGPPAGEARPNGPLNPGLDGGAPGLSLKAARRAGRRRLVSRGLKVRVKSDEAAEVSLLLYSHDRARRRRRRRRGTSPPRPKAVRYARGSARIEMGGGTQPLRLKLGRAARRRLRRRPRRLTMRLVATAKDGAGNTRVVMRRVRVSRARRRRRRRR